MMRSAAGAAPPRTAVADGLPDGACDCHVHVIGDPAEFPFSEARVYTPPRASVEALLELQRALGLSRVIVVQPSVYGSDNSCTLDAVQRLGRRARGVAVIDGTTSRRALEEMDRGGIRGVRLNVETHHPGGFDPQAAGELLDRIIRQIDGLGWHVQIYARISILAALATHLAQLPLPLAIDHFGGANPAQARRPPGFDALLRLVASGAAYVKLSGAYRISQNGPD